MGGRMHSHMPGSRKGAQPLPSLFASLPGLGAEIILPRFFAICPGFPPDWFYFPCSTYVL